MRKNQYFYDFAKMITTEISIAAATSPATVRDHETYLSAAINLNYREGDLSLSCAMELQDILSQTILTLPRAERRESVATGTILTEAETIALVTREGRYHVLASLSMC